MEPIGEHFVCATLGSILSFSLTPCSPLLSTWVELDQDIFMGKMGKSIVAIKSPPSPSLTGIVNGLLVLGDEATSLVLQAMLLKLVSCSGMLQT